MGMVTVNITKKQQLLLNATNTLKKHQFDPDSYSLLIYVLVILTIISTANYETIK